MMTIIDLLIIVISTLSAIFLYRFRKQTGLSSRVTKGPWLIVAGISFVGLFYFFDLLVMFVFPLWTGPDKAMEIMADLHLNLRWVVMPISMLCILLGFMIHARTNINIIQELNKAKLALNRSDRDLEDFAFIASHDLQEPLRKISIFGEKLSNNLNESEDKNKVYLNKILNSSERMKNFINDLLEYSKLDSPNKSFQTFELEKVMNTVLEDLENQIKINEVKITAPSLPTICGDPILFRMIFNNLISNAIKYRRPDVTPAINIESSFIQDKKLMIIKVQDNGIGINNEHLKKIFKPFERLHRQSAYGGTGIGLAICEKIMHRHGGTIQVESEPQKGSNFILSLPQK